MPGKFIVFDGIDGCGKTTMMLKTSEYLYKSSVSNDNILLTREPTYSAIGAKIRKLVRIEKDPGKDPRQFLNLFLADRINHLKEVIHPALAKGFLVLCDRYKHANIAYQAAQGIPVEDIIEPNSYLTVPDLTIILDIEPGRAFSRIGSRTSFTKFEKKEFLEKARKNFLRMKKMFPKENIRVIDSDREKEAVFGDIKRVLDKEF